MTIINALGRETQFWGYSVYKKDNTIFMNVHVSGQSKFFIEVKEVPENKDGLGVIEYLRYYFQKAVVDKLPVLFMTDIVTKAKQLDPQYNDIDIHIVSSKKTKEDYRYTLIKEDRYKESLMKIKYPFSLTSFKYVFKHDVLLTISLRTQVSRGINLDILYKKEHIKDTTLDELEKEYVNECRRLLKEEYKGKLTGDVQKVFDVIAKKRSHIKTTITTR